VDVYVELPDAPAEVQVEAGPQHGTLLVMWLPVKVTERSCTAAITGYSVYVDGRRVKELQSPTGITVDHWPGSACYCSLIAISMISVQTLTNK